MSLVMNDERLGNLVRWAVEIPAVPLWVEAEIVALANDFLRLREERNGGWAKQAVREQKLAFAAEDRLATLAETVTAMRDAQKDYFRTRHQEALTKSKKLEREVDDLLKVIASGGPVQEQGRLA